MGKRAIKRKEMRYVLLTLWFELNMAQIKRIHTTYFVEHGVLSLNPNCFHLLTTRIEEWDNFKEALEGKKIDVGNFPRE